MIPDDIRLQFYKLSAEPGLRAKRGTASEAGAFAAREKPKQECLFVSLGEAKPWRFGFYSEILNTLDVNRKKALKGSNWIY